MALNSYNQAELADRPIELQRAPADYRHWRLEVAGETARLTLDVDENAPVFPGYQLKLNSYDLGVDIELADALQRLRFEHPGVKVVVVGSGKPRVFCAGANIRMLAQSSHAHLVNFCKFSNETRNGMEDASAHSGLRFLAAVKGSAAGGGYELALACDEIILADDANSTVSLPEIPLLAVLPGTGGLTRLTDKRKVRRDRADAFCTTEEGIKGRRAVEWRLVDRIAPASQFDAAVATAAARLAATSSRESTNRGIVLNPLDRRINHDTIAYTTVHVEIDRPARRANVTLMGPIEGPPSSPEGLVSLGDQFHALRQSRELDDAIVHLRLNELEIGTFVFRSVGDPILALAHDAFLAEQASHWLVREIVGNWRRVLKRIDLTSRSLVALVEPGSCFAGTLAEIVLAADRAFMLAGTVSRDNRPEATIALSRLNLASYPMSNGLSRLETRFFGEPESLVKAGATIGLPLDADAAATLGLVTEAFDEIDWTDEVRIFLEERASFSADGLTALEANLRFPGPETMETRIFGRLTAWQNWVFNRPNASGPDGALSRYGSGVKGAFNQRRV